MKILHIGSVERWLCIMAPNNLADIIEHIGDQQKGPDEIYEAVIMSWDYLDFATKPPAIRYRLYTVRLEDGRMFRIKEEKLLELEEDDTVLVIVPAGKWGQAYLSEKRGTGDITLPNEDYLQLHKMV